MIQFNLLPEIKLQYVKARRTKHLVTLIATVAAIGSLVILLLMFVSVDVVQKKSLRDLNNDIATNSKQLKSVPNLNKILTVQNQLNTLTSLHDQKVVASRLFGYISQVTPNQATIDKLTVDFTTAHSITIDGDAQTLDVVNTFTDTLKNTNYTTSTTGSTTKKAFSNVVLTQFGRSPVNATYSITFNFDPIIFNSASNVTLTVPAGATGAQQLLFQKDAGS